MQSISDNDSQRTLTTLININKTESKFYVYTLNGVLIKRVSFKNESIENGEAVTVSPNGQNFIF